MSYLRHVQCFILEFLVLAFIKSASPFTINLFEQFFQKSGNDTKHVMQMICLTLDMSEILDNIYILVFSKQCKFPTVRYTLWSLYLKLIFGNYGNSVFLIKNYSKSSDICANFLNSQIVGRRKVRNPSFNIICNILSI